MLLYKVMFNKTYSKATYKKKGKTSWRTKTWRVSFFYNSCRTKFINIIEEEGICRTAIRLKS